VCEFSIVDLRYFCQQYLYIHIHIIDIIYIYFPLPLLMAKNEQVTDEYAIKLISLICCILCTLT